MVPKIFCAFLPVKQLQHEICASRCNMPPYSACREQRRTGLSGGIKTKHQQAHFLAAEDLGQGAGECGAHGGVCFVVVLWSVVAIMV